MNTTATIETAATAPANPNALAAQLAEAKPSAGSLDALVDARGFEELSPGGRLDVVTAWEKLLRHAHAGLVRCLGALARGAGSEGWLVETELCAALAWSPTTAQMRLAEAEALTHLFPDTVQLLSEGRVSVEQARSLAQLTAGLSDTTAQAVEARVLPRMPGQSAAVTRQALRRAVLRIDAEAAAKRHRHERERRRVELRPEDDGMATLSFYLPADVAQMAMRTLSELAQRAKRECGTGGKGEKSGSDRRTLDQRRADLLLPALIQTANYGNLTPAIPAPRNATAPLNAAPLNAVRFPTASADPASRPAAYDDTTANATSADITTADGTTATAAATATATTAATAQLVSARINVVVGIETLLGLSHEPGHLDGYGPICPEQTRRIAQAHGARWRFLLTATDGTPVHTSPRTYTPRAAVKHLAELKYRTCAFPHCQMPTDRCDIDHNQAFHKGGPTSVSNLAPLCRRHHNGKSHGDWQLDRQGDNIVWTSKHTGRSYTTGPTRYQPAPTTN